MIETHYGYDVLGKIKIDSIAMYCKRAFRAFAEGFLSMTAETLTENEVNTLASSCLTLTAELATRFLADYILGDPYFNIAYPEHNLVRTRCQIALAKDMIRMMPEMERIIRDCVTAAKK